MVTIKTCKPLYSNRFIPHGGANGCTYVSCDFTEETLDTPHIAKGDYRECTDVIWLYQRYDSLKLDNEHWPITTTLHRQLEGQCIAPLRSENPTYRNRNLLPITSWAAWTPDAFSSSYNYYVVSREIAEGYYSVFDLGYSKERPGEVIMPAGGFLQLAYKYDPSRPFRTNYASIYVNGVKIQRWVNSSDPAAIEFQRLKSQRTESSCKAAQQLLWAQSLSVGDYAYYSANDVPGAISVDTVNKEKLRRYLQLADLSECKLPYLDSNYLAQEAYQDIGYIDNNGIAYLLDAVQFRQLIKSFASSLKSILHTQGKTRAKAAAQSYLAEHYGFRLQIKDTIEYIRGIQEKQSFMSKTLRRCSASRPNSNENWVGSSRYTCYYTLKDETNRFSELLRILDLAPTMENAWDLVPMSFVVDWFLSLSKELTALDNAINLQTAYTVKGYVLTTNLSRTISTDWSDVGGTGSLNEHYFARRIGKTPITPFPSIGEAQQTSSLPSHTVEGAALLITRS